MNKFTKKSTSRREFLKNTGRIAAASALAAGVVPRIYAAENNTIKVALIGCGGRGTGAAFNALSVKNGPIELVAMADVFEDRLARSYKSLMDRHHEQVQVPKDRRFIGFDGYKKAMDCLNPGDVAIFATPPAFRWVHFTYAIAKGIHVFMEKPITVDGPSTRKFLKLAEESVKKNLKVGVGLMSRHSRALEELAKRVHDGEIGELILQRGYRMGGRAATCGPVPPGRSELLYQVRLFHSFLWASGGMYSDYYIHIIDHLGWMKNAWPIKAQALGGRHYRGDSVDQNFDHYAVEYTYADGTKFNFDGRAMTGCQSIYSSYLHGTKGMAIASKSGDCGRPSSTYKGQTPERSAMIWQSKVNRREGDPYQNEWNDLIDAIRQDKPYNEAKRGAEASLVNSMGRMAAHTGQVVTYDDILNCEHEFAPDVDKLTMDSPAPLRSDSEGKYPVPQPGILKDREYKEFA
ncbi:MAG: Gfo/Idh/MocA family oxidoreductase [Alphaproteobacteria bacterium]|nr:Gfo/Idh/MocA family oxidoreductase [Alphaproteobacteria bacterium]